MYGPLDGTQLATPAVNQMARQTFVSRRWLTGIVFTILGFDQATKALVRECLPLHTSVNIVPGFLDVTHVRNTGVAFGLLNATDIPFKPAIMTAVALVALIAIAIYISRSSPHEPLARIGLALILGGAIGNLTDRVTAGYVIDFIDVYWRDWHFWVFNVADSAITVGTGFLILDVAILNRHVSDTV